MKKKPFNWVSCITIIGAVIIFFIIFTDAVDSIYILPVLGAMCLVYGIFGLLQAKNSNEAGIAQRAVLQLILGIFVIALGLIEALHLNLPQNFWNALLIIFLAVIIISIFLRRRR